jgi:WD40 repeat protein
VTSAKVNSAQQKPVTLVWFPDFSPDAKWLVTPHGSWKANEAGEVRVWNVQTGKPKHIIASPRGVRTVVWSPKGTFFASGNYQGDLRLYDPETGEVTLELQTLRGESIEILQISPDEQKAYGSSGSGQIHEWDLKGKQHKSALKAHAGGIWGMRLSPDGQKLATAGKDTYVRVWDIATGKLLHGLKHPTETNGVAFTSDNAMLATGCADGKIRLFDVATGKEHAAVSGHGGAVTDLCFTSDNKRLVSSGGDQTVRVWDVAQKMELSLWPGHAGFVFGATYSYDDKLVATGSWDGTARIWDAAAGTQLHELKR